MNLFLYILLLFLIYFSFAIATATDKSILKVSFWLYSAYSLLILTNIFSGIEYAGGDIWRIVPYLICCLALIVLGEKIGLAINFKSSKKFALNLTFLNLLVIIGSVILIVDMFRLNQINFGLRIEDRAISFLGVLGSILSGLGLYTWIVSLYNFRINKKSISILSYLSLVGYLSGGILNAGRQFILFILIASFIVYIWSFKHNRKTIITPKFRTKIPLGIILILFSIFSYLFVISSVRSQILLFDNKVKMYEKFYNASIKSSTIKQVESLDPFSDVYLEFLFYYSHQLRRLDLFYQNYSFTPLFGLNQLPYVERRFSSFLGNMADESWRYEELSVQKNGGFSSHTWGTFITNSIIDFGRIGTLFYCLFIGLLAGILYKKTILNYNCQNVIRLILFCSGIVFSIQFSPLVELAWSAPFILSFFIKVKDV